MSDEPPDDGIPAALEFLAVPGRGEKLLRAHYDRGDGICACCAYRVARWPCSMATLALRAVAGRPR